ncbi:MAG: hypothetical protein ACK5P7_04005 [Bdellovibrio sp.]|jgi:hypothetical protein
MTRQNRTLGFLVLFSIGILTVLLWGAGVIPGRQESLARPDSPTTVSDLAEPSGPESMGDLAPGAESAIPELKKEAELSFAQILSDMDECFGLKSPELPPSSSLSIETVLSHVQSDWGSPIRIEDRWMSWHLRNREGRERRLRLEVTENDEGRTTRELHYFAVDREGLPIPLELDPEKARNPSDETLNQMLREGDVFFKERAGVVQFSDNGRIDFVNIDGTLSEIEMVKGEAIFRCVNMKAREACSCVK